MGTDSKENIRRGLSDREALALTRLAGRGRTIITIGDIEEALGITYSDAKQIAHDLVRKRWLDRLKPGTYLIVPLAAGETGEYTEHEYVIADHLADPMYISYWSALDHHGLTEQVPLTVYAATTATAGQVPTREIHGVTYRFVTLTERKFFGYRPEAIGTHSVDIATVEKALADCADHPEHCGGIIELAKALGNADGLDTAALADSLLRMENGAAIKRLVYLADLLDIELAKRDTLEQGFTTGYPRLDPTRDDDGRHSRQYRLRLNVPEPELERVAGDRR